MLNELLGELKSVDEWILHVQKQMDAFGDKIKKDFDIQLLKNRLLTLPQEIKTSQIDALNKKDRLTEPEQQMKQREAEVMFEINSEKGENGKSVFTNDPTRRAELIKRLGKDKEYLSLRRDHSVIEFKVGEFEAETDKLRREFQALLAHKDLIVAEMNLYTK